VFVGACRLELEIAESSSLKDKRQVVRSVISRLKNRFNVAVAEIDYQDSWRIAAIGIVSVSNNAGHTERMLQEVIQYVTEMRLDAEIGEHIIDVVEMI
jgi:uncharacterized protein YlxP (DUF503 family)